VTSPYAPNTFDPDANNSWARMFDLVPERSRVLDVGCSTGGFGLALRELKGCEVVGVDLNADDVAVAATRLDEAVIADVTDPAALAPLGSFDVIVLADVLEHLPDPHAALQHAIRPRLRPDGVVVYSIPNMAHVSVRLDVLAGRFAYTDLGLLDRTHLHFYDRTEVRDLFARSGLRIVAERPVLAPYPAAWLGEELARVGLASTARFFAHLAGTDGHTYQFVGTAVVGGDVPIHPPAPHVSPIDAVDIELATLRETAGRATEEAERLAAELAAVREEVATLHDDRQRILTELRNLEEVVIPQNRRLEDELRRIEEGEAQGG
jgi:2-polyprenyl-3-methyl-5-hydroxy-6-metoxy-1,4-benzoquinol methylase